MCLQKPSVVLVSCRGRRKRVDQLSRNMLCTWKESGTKGNCRVFSPCLSPDFYMTHHFLGFRKELRGRPLASATRTLSPCPLATGIVDCLQTLPSSFSHSQGNSGAPMVCIIRGTQRLFQVGVFSWGIKSGFRGKPGMFLSVARIFRRSRRRQKRRGKPTPSQEPGEAPCLMLLSTPYC